MKQKTLFACLAAFAAVFAFSACDGFDDGSVPIDDVIRGGWKGSTDSEEWTLTFSGSGNFTLTGSRKATEVSEAKNIVMVEGTFDGSIEDAGREGDVSLWGDGDDGYSYDIEMEYIRNTVNGESLIIEDVDSFNGGDIMKFRVRTFYR